MVTQLKNVYEIDDSFDRLNFDTLEKWLSKTYWSPGIKKDDILRGARNSSIVVGCYAGNEQVGFLRVISDKLRFAYILDVYVEENHRRKGIAQAMVRFVLDHPDYNGIQMWLLATKDAHGVYSKAGFKPLPNPEVWMVIRNHKIWSA